MSKKNWSNLYSLQKHVTERYATERQRLAALRTQQSLEKAHRQHLRSSPGRSSVNKYMSPNRLQMISSRREEKMAPVMGNGKSSYSEASQFHAARPINAKPESVMYTSDSNNNSKGQIKVSQGSSGKAITKTVASKSTAKSDIEESQVSLVCPVIMCKARFSTREQYQSHVSPGGNHSPCHPCSTLLNRQAPQDHLSYACPVCGSSSQSEDLCQKHLVDTGHDILGLMSPIKISAHCCPGCLLLFSDKPSCTSHIQTAQHFSFKYSLPDDPDMAEPIPVPDKVVQQLVATCGEVEWHMECVDCGHYLLPEEDFMRFHVNKFHSVMALTSNSPAEVFEMFMKKYSCIQCLRLFRDLPPEGLDSFHQCSPKLSGLIIMNECRTFKDLLLKNALEAYEPEVITIDDSPLPVIPSQKRKRDSETSDCERASKVMKLLACGGSDTFAIPDVCVKASTSTWSSYRTKSDPLPSLNRLSVIPPNTSSRKGTDVSQSPLSLTIPTPCSNKKLHLVQKKKVTSLISSPRAGVSLIPDGLSHQKHVLFLDLDNWPSFFKKLPQLLPEGVFVWAFFGGKNDWNTPTKVKSYQDLVKRSCFHLHNRCGTTKDAADFAMVLYIGKMDERLPKHIPFTILSGDKGFCELERQMKASKRRAVVINPYNRTEQEVYSLIASVTSV